MMSSDPSLPLDLGQRLGIGHQRGEDARFVDPRLPQPEGEGVVDAARLRDRPDVRHAHTERPRYVDPDTRHPRFPGRVRSFAQLADHRMGVHLPEPYGGAGDRVRRWERSTMRYGPGSGRVGVWTFAFDALRAGDVRDAAAAIESLGYPALWVPEGGSSREIFAHLSLLLAATSAHHGLLRDRQRHGPSP